MVHYANPPLLLENLIDDHAAVLALLERNAPYTPLGGWFRPDQGDGEAMSPMWFQNDWMHADFVAAGAELFQFNERVMQASREFYDAEIVIPHSIYVNLFAAIKDSGPAHTDNPKFSGRDRSNTPMMLLRSMFWSGLFGEWAITQATSIWWMNDVEGGGFRYWPHGPAQEPEVHVGAMENTALVGDNHGMFHQVEPVGPFNDGTIMVNAEAELAPVGDKSPDWQVTYNGDTKYRAPLSDYRVSVLWKADIYKDAADKERLQKAHLSLDDVARVFNADLASRGEKARLNADAIDDTQVLTALGRIYPEPIPVNAGRSIFDV